MLKSKTIFMDAIKSLNCMGQVSLMQRVNEHEQSGS